jgi:hypothetical protein
MSGQENRRREPRRVRLPGFVSEGDVGLGNAIKRLTSSLGIRSCAGCERRAAALNRRVVLYSSRQSRRSKLE